ncbi:MAG: magnesium transporter CorA family protein [Solirubrobacterales bacterium]
MAERQFEIMRELDSARIAELRRSGDFFWVDVATHDGPSCREIADAFGLSDSAAEALENFHTAGAPARKIHVEKDLIVFPFWCSATPESERHPERPLDLLRVNVVLHGDFLLTVHQRRFDLPGAVAEFAPGQSEQYAVYVALDGMTDTVLDSLATIEHEIAELETRLLASGFRPRPADKRMAARLRQQLTYLRMRVGPERALFERVGEEIKHIGTLKGDHEDYFDRISGQLDRAVERIDAAREALADALQAQLNETSYRLTIVATIFLPLSFITGFFGMNFTWLTDRIESGPAFWLLGVGALVLPLLFIVVFLELGVLHQLVRRIRGGP